MNLKTKTLFVSFTLTAVETLHDLLYIKTTVVPGFAKAILASASVVTTVLVPALEVLVVEPAVGAAVGALVVEPAVGAEVVLAGNTLAVYCPA